MLGLNSMMYEIKKERSEICSPDRSQKGVSLLELLIVVTIIGVFAAVAIPNFTTANARFQRQNFARQLKVYLERARFDSVKRNAVSADELARVVIESSTLISLGVDADFNGRIDNSEISRMPVSTGSGVKIVGKNLIFPITVTFNNRGQARAIDGMNASIAPIFTVCEKNCTALTASPENSETLSVSPTGTTAFVKPGDVFLDPVVPNVSAVSTGSKIDPMAQVNH